MQFYICDYKGIVGELAGTGGVIELREFLVPKCSEIVKELFENGCIEFYPDAASEELVSELKNINCDNAELKESIDKLADLISQCKDIAIISNGAAAILKKE